MALVTGGDSGIGRAVAVLYAREGADVAIVYLPEEQSDAEETRDGGRGGGAARLLIPGDVDATRVLPATRSSGPCASSAASTCSSTTPPSSSTQESLEDLTDEQFDAHVQHEHLRLLLHGARRR